MTSLSRIAEPAPHQQTADPQAAPASSTGTARIALSAPADLAALRAAAMQAARARIDAHLPPSANTSTSATTSARPDAPQDASSASGDALRAHVEQTVDAWLRTLFTSVRANLDINGLPGTSAALDDGSAVDDAGADADTFEAYDAPLAGRVVALHGQIEALQAELAGLRRAGAGEGAAAFKGAFAAWGEALEAGEAREAGTEPGAAADAPDAAVKLDAPAFAGREAQLAARFEAAVQQLGGLQGSMAGTAGRAAEAVRVARYMDGGGAGGA